MYWGTKFFTILRRDTWNHSLVSLTYLVDEHSALPAPTSWTYLISNFPPSAAELFRLPPHRSGTHYQEQSFRHQHCSRFSTNWKLSHFNDPSFVSTVLVVSLILFWLIDWLIDDWLIDQFCYMLQWYSTNIICAWPHSCVHWELADSNQSELAASTSDQRTNYRYVLRWHYLLSFFCLLQDIQWQIFSIIDIIIVEIYCTSAANKLTSVVH